MNPYLLINLNQKYMPIPPTDYSSTKDLMIRLPHKLKVICALQAVKLVLPIWEKLAPENNEYKQVVNIIERWIAGNATEEELGKAWNVPAISTISHNKNNHIYYTVAFTADTLATLDNTDAARHVANAVYNAANFMSLYHHAEPELGEMTACQWWRSQWWKNCEKIVELEFQNKYNIICKEIEKVK